MALTCDAFGGGTAPLGETIIDTQQTFACAEMCVEQREPNDTEFFLLVIDALNRLASADGFNVSAALIANLTADDAMNAVENALCATEEISRSLTDTDPQKAKAYILAQLSNLLCAS